MSGQKVIRVSVDELPVGTQLQHAINDQSGKLLLSAGTSITARFKSQLLQHGIDQVSLHPDDAPNVAEEKQLFSFSSSDDVEGRAEDLLNSVSLAIENDGPPLIDSAEDLGCTPYSREQAARLIKRFNAATELVEATIRGILGGSDQNADRLVTVATEYTTEVVEDADHVVSVSEELGYSAETAQRSVRMATLGMATGLKLRLDQEHCRELGVCALVHDLGIHGLPQRLQDESEPFSQDDWSEYKRHPYRTLDLLEHVHGLSDSVRLAASQVHENADGSGFPRGLGKDHIHPYARIVNVVDAYIHLTSNVRGRPAIFPYDALICILRHTKLGRFDPESVRPLVDLLSVFPLGSHVLLSDGAEAKVLRRGESGHTLPIVQRIREGDIVNISSGDVTIKDILPTPGRKEMRLDDELMEDFVWYGNG